MSQLFQPRLSDVIQELAREKITRQDVYPRWVSKGRLHPTTADHRVACLEQAIHILNCVNESEQIQELLGL